jgi:hypothetical protein
MEKDIELSLTLFDGIMKSDVNWSWKHVQQLQPLTEHVYTIVRMYVSIFYCGDSQQVCLQLTDI